ncbi:hypothetical protein QYE76_062905 [Lolium multiflorum]|uniref:RNase H type-1 domain-containing protein n=1 Tax=Lolium multiflorum TaxID=4521 RepID=A0AAD8S4N0_LOLMU|nr:hypothetical protein QYE76_062905 [Lolium multiflorum]
MIFLLWRVWHHRNNVVYGDGKASIVASARYIANYYESFIAAPPQNLTVHAKENSQGRGSPGQASLIPSSTWKAPPEGCLKANVDAGWDPSSKRAGLGVAIRDWKGQVILTEWKFVPICTSAEEAEVLACLEGLRHLIDLRQWPARLETDCLRVVQGITGHDQNRSLSWTSYDEACELLKIYQDINVVKVDRASNAVAHGLAQLGKSGASGMLRASAPTGVLELIRQECEFLLG